jgi:MFS transporter, DHA1 family, tetracycline resistance protein
MQAFLLQPIVALCGEKGAMVIGTSAMIARSFAYATATSKAQILVATTWGTLSVLTYPAVSSIKANALPDHEQGAVQGALSGVRAIAQGIGPLLFMRLYRLWTQEYYMPQVCTAHALCDPTCHGCKFSQHTGVLLKHLLPWGHGPRA